VLFGQLTGEDLVVAGLAGLEDLVTSTGLPAALAGSPTGTPENSQTGRAASGPAERSASSRAGFIHWPR
jgi:hypothetical protein